MTRKRPWNTPTWSLKRSGWPRWTKSIRSNHERPNSGILNCLPLTSCGSTLISTATKRRSIRSPKNSRSAPVASITGSVARTYLPWTVWPRSRPSCTTSDTTNEKVKKPTRRGASIFLSPCGRPLSNGLNRAVEKGSRNWFIEVAINEALDRRENKKVEPSPEGSQ